MDSEWECRQIDFDEKYFGIYGEYPEDLNPEDFGDIEDYKEERRERVRETRRRLGWR